MFKIERTVKTIFDKETRAELLKRVNSLNENSSRHWGKMNVYQMIKHCILCEEMYLEKRLISVHCLVFSWGESPLTN